VFNQQQTYVQSIADRKLFGTSQSEELVLKLRLCTYESLRASLT